MDFVISIIIIAIYYNIEIKWQIDGEYYIKPRKHFAFIKKKSKE